jgi:hypothetical protein
MADYYPLISRAVSGLQKSTAEARRALYERARTALVDQLRGVTPALSESDITRERLALEEAIRRVEAESIRQTKVPSPEPRPAAAPSAESEEAPAAPAPADEAASASAPPDDKTMREPTRPGMPMRRSERRWLDKKPTTAEAPRSEPRTAVAEARPARETTAVAPEARPERVETRRVPPRVRVAERRTPTPKDMDLGIEALEPDESQQRQPSTHTLEPPVTPESLRYIAERARRAPDQDEAAEPATSRITNSIVAIVIAAVLIAVVGATLYWQRHNILALLGGQLSSRRTVETKPPDAAQQRTKIPDRIGQQDATSPSQKSEAAVAQRVVLYEEDPTDSAGRRFAGTAIWRTESAPPAPGQPPELAVRADITIPERGIQATWSLRRNTDKDLPASHTVSIMFNLPPDFSHGEVAEIRGVLMKQSEQARGVSLAGLSVKVTTGFFLIGLSAAEADMQRNIQMLKERSWFDIAIVYKDGRRAILAVEKGTPGERAFAEGFAAWGQ